MSSKAFNAVLADINKTYGLKTIGVASESEHLNRFRRIPVGILSFDVASGGGYPHGHILQLRGEESSGKSLLAQKIAAAFQRMCRNCGRPMCDWDELLMKKTLKRCCKNPESMRVVWFDVERVWTNAWAKRMGIDPSLVYLMRTEFAEQGIDVGDVAIRSGEADLLVVDSLAAMTPSEEIKESTENWQMGLQPRLLGKAMRKWTSAMNTVERESGKPCSVVMINQIRMKIGVVYGNPKTSPGGKAIRFHSDLIGDCKKSGYLEDDLEMAVGHEMEVVLRKNRTSPPMRKASFDIAFKSMQGRKAGSSNLAHQVLTLGQFWKVIKVNGAWYHMAKGVKLQGIDAAAKFLMKPENRPTLNMLIQQVKDKELAWWDEDCDDEVQTVIGGQNSEGIVNKF